MFGLCLGHFFRENDQMASSVAPGYNPETSLLQGGTAPIVAVQGGGGMEAGAIPAGYNPAQSLLNTPSSATIVAIRGGGNDGTKPYEGYVLEKYEPPLDMIELPTALTSVVRRDLIAKYITASLPSLKEVQSLERAPVTFAFTNEVAPTYQKCSTETGKRRLPLNFFEIVRKRIVFIDEPEPYIWVIPNLKGSLSRFIQYMNKIPKTSEGTIEKQHYVLFTGAFFSLTASSDNILLYEQFLQKKLKNMDQIFYINNLNDDFVNTACSIVRSIYATDTLRSTEGQEKPLSAFFEPDIVLFTKAHIVFKNSELPVQKDDNRVKPSALLKIPTFRTKSFLLVPSRDKFDELPNDTDSVPPEERYFSFFFNRNTMKQVKVSGASVLTCPSGQTCSGFQGGYRLVDVGDERKLEELGLYLISNNTDKMPFLKEAGSTLPTAVPVAVAAAAEPETKENKEEVVSGVAAPSVKRGPMGILPKAKPTPKAFVASASAVKAKAEQTLTIDKNDYRIRIPLEKAVRENWMKGIFTADEVELLNALQLSEDLLIETFGTLGWQVKLADFLEAIVLSNCYQDTRLMTRIECSNSQQFVRKVYFTLYTRTLSSLYDSLGYVKPSKLEDVLDMLKRLAALGDASGKTAMTKYEFTGDLLGRHHTVHFDPVKQEYYVDFVEMTEDVKTLLDTIKLFRTEDKNIDTVIDSLLKRLNIPTVAKGGGERKNREEEEIFDLGDPQN